MERIQKQKITIAFFVTVIAAGMFMYTLTQALFEVPENLEDGGAIEKPITATTSERVEDQLIVGPVEIPTQFLIPKLGIDAAIQQVGLTETGAMGIPTNYTDVAWYQPGTVPGQIGSAVIDGHVDNGLALPAVFHDLHTLAAGDIVSIITEEGTQLDFAVERVEEYPYENMPLEEIFHRNDAQRLNLITCSGAWIQENKTYDSRVVVYTKLVSS